MELGHTPAEDTEDLYNALQDVPNDEFESKMRTWFHNAFGGLIREQCQLTLFEVEDGEVER